MLNSISCTDRHKLKIGPSLFVAILFYVPILRNITGSSGASQYILNLIVLASGILIFNGVIFRFKKIPRITIACFVLSFYILILSLIYDSTITRLISDVGRLILAGFFAWFGSIFSKRNILNEGNLSKYILKYIAFGVLFSLLVFFDVFYPIVDLYKGRLSNDELIFHFMRASGFAGFPTDFGCLIVFGFLLLSYRKIEIVKSPDKYFYWLFFIGLTFSAARGAIIQLVGLFFMYFQFSFIKYYGRYFIYILFFFLFALIIYLSIPFSLNFSEDSQLFDQKLSIFSYIFSILEGGDDSIMHRFAELQLSWQIIIGELNIPTGSAREEPFGLSVIESLWGHYFIRYGFFGALGYLIFSIYIIMLLRRSKNNNFGWAVYYWFISFLIFVAPFSDVMSRLRGLPFYFFIIGYATSLPFCKLPNTLERRHQILTAK